MLSKIERIKLCINELSKITNDDKKSFNLILDFMCQKLKIRNALFSYTPEIKNILDKRINRSIFISKDTRDILGEIYEEIYNVKLLDYNEASRNVLRIRFNIKKGKVNNINIAECETGRCIMALHDKFKNIFFYANESNPVQYKISILNIALYNIPCRILYTSENKNTRISKPEHYSECLSNCWIKT